jgi:hypothetical protein
MRSKPLFLILLFYLTACSTTSTQPEILTTSTFQPLSAIFTPSPKNETTQETSEPTEPPVKLPYEFLSPTKISINNMVFEVFASISPSEFKFWIDATLPPTSYNSPPIFTDVKFLYPSTGSDLPLVGLGGGGGGGGGGTEGPVTMGQENDYRVKFPLISGQRIYILALVTFHEFTGITGPVRFELNLIVQ